ncbi:MAG: FtsW/RodA/SpoVE family cell cycle protein, partial [Rubrivivax sp.]
EAMRALLLGAGWQWAGATGIGFVLLLWSRSARAPALGVATALAAWAGAAWLARVGWPLAPHPWFEPARPAAALDQAFDAPPAGFVLWLLGGAAVLLLTSLVAAPRPAARPRAAAPSSRIGYAGLALATGLGWLLLLDLSANGHPINRYLGLYHQGHLWLAFLVFSVVLFLRRPFARGLAWALVVAGEAGRGVARRAGRGPAFALLIAVALTGVAAFGVGLANLRQLTSELGRVWLIAGAAWFFFLRGGPIAERLARAGPLGASLLRYAWPMLFVVGVLLGAMVATRDMGPLLIAGYASGAFIAASLAMWAHLRFSRRPGAGAVAPLLAVALFAGWIVMVTLVLLRFGEVHDVTAMRLESLAAPFTSANDQLALVTWFQRAAPEGGFGLGATPWCGYSAAGQCSGVPAQIHSDYTFTAIVGVFGRAAGWATVLGGALWLHRLIRHHGRVTRGEPRLLPGVDGYANDAQALLSWIGVAWVVLTLSQLGVTVAGNLALLPLTGVTVPFVSFGMTSLVVNLAFLALVLSVDRPDHE